MLLTHLSDDSGEDCGNGPLVSFESRDTEVPPTLRRGHHTMGRNRPTISCNRPVIWPSEQTSTASSNAGKQFSPRSTTAANLSSARFVFCAFFFLNFFRRSTCNFCFAR